MAALKVDSDVWEEIFARGNHIEVREAEVYLAEGVKVGEVFRRLGVDKITYYR